MSKLKRVRVSRDRVRLGDYEVFHEGIARALRRRAAPLRGTRVMHVNATSRGGGVAELLASQIPFERALGMDSRWYVVSAPERFFAITKQIHNLLQGKPGGLTAGEEALYDAVSRDLARSFARITRSFHPDIIVIHDPQPLALVAAAPAPVIVRLHGDLLSPNKKGLKFVRPFLLRAARVIVSSREYARNMPWLPNARVAVIAPAIDPLAGKNKDIPATTVRRIIKKLGIGTGPMIAQVSRFDPWKDPVGVVKAYGLAKKKVPGLQLVLAGLFLAKDDPEALRVFAQVRKYTKGDPSIFLFADPRTIKGVPNAAFINAIYAASTVVMQKSIREGFGLTMTEAMWKGKALVAGATTGALAQIKSGENGILVSSPQEAARALVRLLGDPALRERLGRAAHESVRRRFLMPRFVTENLDVYRGVIAQKGRKTPEGSGV